MPLEDNLTAARKNFTQMKAKLVDSRGIMGIF